VAYDAVPWCLIPRASVGKRFVQFSLTFAFPLTYHARSPETPKELYNLRHASLRNAIERAFGVLKKRFPILTRTPVGYSFETQVDMVLGICVLHNLIREYCDEDDDIQTAADRELAQRPVEAPMGAAAEDDVGASEKRDEIANAMWTQYQAILTERGVR
jgi:hypothetical protein